MHSIECILQVPGNFFANDALICKSTEMPCRTSAITQPPHWHCVPYHATSVLTQIPIWVWMAQSGFSTWFFLATYTMLPTFRVSPTPNQCSWPFKKLLYARSSNRMRLWYCITSSFGYMSGLCERGWMRIEFLFFYRYEVHSAIWWAICFNCYMLHVTLLWNAIWVRAYCNCPIDPMFVIRAPVNFEEWIRLLHMTRLLR